MSVQENSASMKDDHSVTFTVSVAVAVTKIMLETQLFAEVILERMHRCLFRCDRRAMVILNIITGK